MVANIPTGTNGVLSPNVNEEENKLLPAMKELPSQPVKKQYQKTKDNNNEVAERKMQRKLATMKERYAKV